MIYYILILKLYTLLFKNSLFLYYLKQAVAQGLRYYNI